MNSRALVLVLLIAALFFAAFVSADKDVEDVLSEQEKQELENLKNKHADVAKDTENEINERAKKKFEQNKKNGNLKIQSENAVDVTEEEVSFDDIEGHDADGHRYSKSSARITNALKGLIEKLNDQHRSLKKQVNLAKEDLMRAEHQYEASQDHLEELKNQLKHANEDEEKAKVKKHIAKKEHAKAKDAVNTALNHYNKVVKEHKEFNKQMLSQKDIIQTLHDKMQKFVNVRK